MLRKIFLLSCFLLSMILVGCGEETSKNADPEVDVTGGKIKGFVDSNGVKIFKGIPYADTTAGENRWKAPQPVKAWEGVLDCTKDSPIVIQNAPVPFDPWTDEYVDGGYTIENGKISEDSLRLNIWTKADADAKKPVIVYIHGGANISGSGNNEVYKGDNIAQKDVVYVSINYRVGIFGFLAYKDLTGEEVKGNFAIQDQIAALKWIKENISKFGGDPNNVTIMGQSAGSTNVQNLIMSPKAEGLFNKAVYLSFNNATTNETVIRSLEDAELEANENLSGKTLAELRQMDAMEVFKMYRVSSSVIDGEYLNMSTKDAFESGEFNKVDMICGGVPGDSYLFDAAINLGNFMEPVLTLTETDYNSKVGETFAENSEVILSLYALPANPENVISAAKDVNNDKLISSYYEVAQKKNSNDSAHKSYVYFFRHPIPDTPERMEKFGAFHTGDVGYWLSNFTKLYPRIWTDTDKKLGDEMSSYLANFAKTGNPNGENLPEWQEVGSTKNISYLDIGDEIKFVEMNPDKSDFWTKYWADR